MRARRDGRRRGGEERLLEDAASPLGRRRRLGRRLGRLRRRCAHSPPLGSGGANGAKAVNGCLRLGCRAEAGVGVGVGVGVGRCLA